MHTMASQITGVSIVYSTVCSGADQRKHQSFASLAFVRGIHRWPVNSSHKRVRNAENVSIRWRHHGVAVTWLWWEGTRLVTAADMPIRAMARLWGQRITYVPSTPLSCCRQYRVISQALKSERRHYANSVVTSNTGGFYNDNFRCDQWKKAISISLTTLFSTQNGLKGPRSASIVGRAFRQQTAPKCQIIYTQVVKKWNNHF